jgi:hypothetical protein
MRQKFRTISLLPVLLIGLFLLAWPAKAKTYLEQNNQGDFHVTLKIVFNFQQIAAQEAEAISSNWQAGIDQIWNGPQGWQQVSPYSKISFDFDFKIMVPTQTCADYPEYHCITVAVAKYNQRDNLSDTTLTFANDDKNSTGEWSKKINANNAAHEVGHLLGLTDEYSYQLINGQKKWINDNQQKGGRQSIMAQTWGNVGVFNEHFYKIIKYAH